MPGEFNKFITDYFRSRPWMLEADGSFKISGLDMDPDDPAQWRGGTMTSNEDEARPPEPNLHEGPRTPAEYFTESREWLVEAEHNAREWKANTINSLEDKSAELALLAIASALLGICAKLSQDSKTD